MPMNEYRRSDPRLLTSATALFESGVGRGSNLGSGTANRSATREKRKIKARNLFIAEDSTCHGALALEPGLCFVFAVGFAELGFENLGLFICAENLNRNQNEQKQQCVWPFQRDYDSGQHRAAENINRVANFRVKSVRDKLATMICGVGNDLKQDVIDLAGPAFSLAIHIADLVQQTRLFAFLEVRPP